MIVNDGKSKIEKYYFYYLEQFRTKCKGTQLGLHSTGGKILTKWYSPATK